MSHKAIDAVCTMATRECAEELTLFHRALRTFHPTLPLFLGCTAEMRDAASPALANAMQGLHSDVNVSWVPCLDAYGPSISRKKMEREAGVWYAARHTDFMMEKTHLMELAMRNAHAATSTSTAPVVAFLDCDITLLRALPTVPSTAAVALSPHEMRLEDEALFGRYNGGYVIASSPEVLWEWRRATSNSRYFDQASLEHVAELFGRRAQLHCLDAQHNYGFWRLLQPRRGSAFDEAKRFSVAALPLSKAPNASALTIQYDSHPLCSLHTHFFLHGNSIPRDVRLFNDLLRRWIGRCASADAGQAQNIEYAAALAPIINAKKGSP